MGTQALPNQDPLRGALRPYAHLEAVTLHYQSHATVLRPSFPAGAPCSLQAAYLLMYIPSPGLGSVGGLEIRAYKGQKTAVADMVLTPAAGRGHLCAAQGGALGRAARATGRPVPDSLAKACGGYQAEVARRYQSCDRAASPPAGDHARYSRALPSQGGGQ